MAEYIEKHKVVNLLTALENECQQFKPFEGFAHAMYRKLCETEIAIGKLPAADVVPPAQWIPVAERLPKPETEVMIACNRNGYRFIATAIHEDGTLFTEDSNWNWNDIWGYGLYDEEHDDYIIPEGWWESRCFTPDDVYNCPVDCEVTHWMPMPELPKEENNG